MDKTCSSSLGLDINDPRNVPTSAMIRHIVKRARNGPTEKKPRKPKVKTISVRVTIDIRQKNDQQSEDKYNHKIFLLRCYKKGHRKFSFEFNRAKIYTREKSLQFLDCISEKVTKFSPQEVDLASQVHRPVAVKPTSPPPQPPVVSNSSLLSPPPPNHTSLLSPQSLNSNILSSFLFPSQLLGIADILFNSK